MAELKDRDTNAGWHAFLREATKDKVSFERAVKGEYKADIAPPRNPRNGPSFREFLQDLTPETMIETGDPKLVAEGRDMAAGAVAEEFAARAGRNYYPTDENFNKVVRALAAKHAVKYTDERETIQELFARSVWTVSELNSVVSSLAKQGKLDVPPWEAKELTEEQRRDVAAAVLVDGPSLAISRYLSHAFSGRAPEYEGGERELFALHPEVCSKASLFVFRHHQADFVESLAWRTYLEERTRGREGVLTVPLLQGLWQAFNRMQDRDGSGSPPAAPVPPPAGNSPAASPVLDPDFDLDGLTLEELEALRIRSMRERHRQLSPAARRGATGGASIRV